MSSRLLTALLLAAWTVPSPAAQEWHPVADEEARVLLAAAESALVDHWERTRRGWCRAILERDGDQQQFTFWWDEDKRGLEIEKVTLGDDRDPKLASPEPHLALYLPNEQWIYAPRFRRCSGFGAQKPQRPPLGFEVHPHKIWLAMSDGQAPRHAHLNRLRSAKSPLMVSRDDVGLVAFDTREIRLVFDSQRGFSPVRAEFQTKLDELPHPDVMLPRSEDYELAQDRHGEWYCQQMVRTSWPRGGGGDPAITRSAKIVEYDSRPGPSLLRLSFEAMELPVGTSVQARIPSRPARWVVGRERERDQGVTEQQFRNLGRALKSRGFASEDEP